MTAAISDASTSLSAACWRMMSSWRSGSWISRTTWSAGLTRLKTAAATITKPRVSSTRRFHTRARETLRPRAAGRERVVLADALISRVQLRKNPRQLLLQFAQTAGVLDNVGRSGGFFSLRELPCGAFVQRLVPPGASALGTDGF